MKKGKKFLIVLMVLTLSLNVLVGCTDKEVEAIRKNTSVYSNSEYNIEVRYASDWQINEGYKYVTTFFSPLEDENDTFREYLELEIYSDKSDNSDIQGLVDYTLESLEHDKTNFKIISEKKTKISKSEAYEVIYTSTEKDSNFKTKIIFYNKCDKAFIIQLVAHEDTFDNYIPYFKQFVQDIKY